MGWPAFIDDYDEHARPTAWSRACACTLWLWLDLRFPGVFGEVESVHDLRGRLNDGIERQLKRGASHHGKCRGAEFLMPQRRGR